jgi:hypothetical protein
MGFINYGILLTTLLSTLFIADCQANYINNNHNTTNTNNITSESNQETKLYCGGKLKQEYNALNNEEILKVCTILSNYTNFLIRVRPSKKYLVNKVLLQGSSARFFYQQCNNHTDLCMDGFLIDLYTEDLIVVFQPGKKAKSLVSDGYRKRVIEAMRFYIVRSEWTIALEKGVKLLHYKLNGGFTTNNASQSSKPVNFEWLILYPFLIITFIFITLGLYLLGKGYIHSYANIYFDRVLDLWQQIHFSKEGSIILKERTCLLCLKQEDNSRENITIFKFLYCNHYYHASCIYKWGFDTAQSCPCSFEPVEGEKFSTPDSQRPPYICVDDIKKILQRIQTAFPSHDIFNYFISNSKKIEEFNKNYLKDETLQEICWIYHRKLNQYKKFRIFYIMWKSLKLMCCILAFYPSKLMNSKKGKLIRKLLNVKASGSTIREFK